MKYSDEYASHEADRNRAYREAYESPEVRAWIDSLTPAQMIRAQALGLLEPYIDPMPSGHCLETLPAELIPRVEDEHAEAQLPLPVLLRQKRVDYDNLDEHRLQLLEAFFQQYGNSERVWACLRYLVGRGRCEELARTQHMSKQAFHYHAQRLAEMLKLPTLGNRASERARKAYRRTNGRRRVAPMKPDSPPA